MVPGSWSFKSTYPHVVGSTPKAFTLLGLRPYPVIQGAKRCCRTSSSLGPARTNLVVLSEVAAFVVLVQRLSTDSALRVTCKSG